MLKLNVLDSNVTSRTPGWAQSVWANHSHWSLVFFVPVKCISQSSGRVNEAKCWIAWYLDPSSFICSSFHIGRHVFLPHQIVSLHKYSTFAVMTYECKASVFLCEQILLHYIHRTLSKAGARCTAAGLLGFYGIWHCHPGHKSKSKMSANDAKVTHTSSKCPEVDDAAGSSAQGAPLHEAVTTQNQPTRSSFRMAE